MKRTAVAPSNIAFIKYWGRKSEELRIPENGSVSMNLSNLLTTTTVELDPRLEQDVVVIDGINDLKKSKRVSIHLDRIRDQAKISLRARVESKNNFPQDTGLSSSASGFAALTLAAAGAAGLNLSQRELSILARQGSGSACRSIPDGFVEWLDGDTDATSYAKTLYPPSYWDILDVVVVVSREKKYVSTSEGQKSAASNPFYRVRLSEIKDKIAKLKSFMKDKNFNEFGQLIEAEALELHAIMLTSNPPLLYWLPGTLRIMQIVQKLRQEGLPVYFTVNTGQDVHLIVQNKNVKALIDNIRKVEEIRDIIINNPANGGALVNSHLF